MLQEIGGVIMKWVNLVPNRLCKTPIDVVIYREGLSEDGAPIETDKISLSCNFQDGAKRIFNTQKISVEISGKAYFNGDICPDIPVISGGYVEVMGENRDICEGFKRRNPDGTVNYTELWLK